jgi:peptide/nickel transport system substrate-binding protein
MKKLISVVAALMIFSACAPQQETDIPTLPAAPTEETAPLPTLAPEPRALNICLGEEPTTLYPYGSLNAAARSVLSAIYDGPMDTLEYGYEPVILEKIPNLEDGDAQIETVTVTLGDTIVDATGNVVSLAKGMELYPSDCRSDDCKIQYDGVSDIEMDQMVVTFTMLEGLQWSDGAPLTADDSVYSFLLASEDGTPVSKFLIDRTQVYEAASDGVTIQWWGMPGFIDPDYYTNFFTPLPRHLWGEQDPADLTRLDLSARFPIGWGPYIVQEWTAGESIRLTKNLNYFRAVSGLPHFDELNFLLMPDANAALTALVEGTCDILDPSIRLDGQVGLLQEMESQGRVKLFTAQTMTMEWLGIGVFPSAYDDGLKSQTDRPDFFGDERMRQALAYCLDRQKVVDTVLFGLSQVPDSYLPADHPLHNGNIQTYTFNPEAGSDLLEALGWLDSDNDPVTPRLAFGVTNVPAGTALVLDYYTSSATQRHQVTEIFADSLAECGIGLNARFYNASDFYAQGPIGPLFSRQFELAEYAIGVNSLEPQCAWFTSSLIPTEANNWIGTNISGYENPEFDEACAQALRSLPGEPEYTSHQQAQAIFAADLPSIPLYLRLRVAAARPDLCGFALDPSSNSALAGIESFDYGTGCKP